MANGSGYLVPHFGHWSAVSEDCRTAPAVVSSLSIIARSSLIGGTSSHSIQHLHVLRPGRQSRRIDPAMSFCPPINLVPCDIADVRPCHPNQHTAWSDTLHHRGHAPPIATRPCDAVAGRESDHPFGRFEPLFDTFQHARPGRVIADRTRTGLHLDEIALDRARPTPRDLRPLGTINEL